MPDCGEAMTIDDKTLAEWQAMYDRATPGDWMLRDHDGTTGTVAVLDNGEWRDIGSLRDFSSEDELLLLTLRTALPEAIERIRKLEAALNAARMPFVRHRNGCLYLEGAWECAPGCSVYAVESHNARIDAALGK